MRAPPPHLSHPFEEFYLENNERRVSANQCKLDLIELSNYSKQSFVYISPNVNSRIIVGSTQLLVGLMSGAARQTCFADKLDGQLD